MAKRKIREGVLKNVEELRSAAATARKVASEARSKEVEAAEFYDRKLNDLRVKIATGSYTTGDHLLDINIVVNSSVQMDERYEAMVNFEEYLTANAGKLIAQTNSLARTSQVEKIGLLPESPMLKLYVGPAFGRGLVFGGDASVHVSIPIVEQTGVVIHLLSPKWDGRTPNETTLGSNIVFEDNLQWILENEPNMHLAFALWTSANRFGRPLVASSLLAAEIRSRRESQILVLHKAGEELARRMKKLQELRTSPEELFESGEWYRQDIIQTPEGFHVGLREVGKVAEAASVLQRELNTAEVLQMQDNNTYRECVDLNKQYLRSLEEGPEEDDPDEEIPF